MKIRFIQSMGSNVVNYVANEKDKGGKFIWHEFPDYEAVRLVDGDIAVYAEKAEYEKAKANYAALEAQKKQAHQVSETLKNLGGLKAEVEKKREAYKILGAEIKEIDAKVKAAEATVAPKTEA